MFSSLFKNAYSVLETRLSVNERLCVFNIAERDKICALIPPNFKYSFKAYGP